MTEKEVSVSDIETECVCTCISLILHATVEISVLGIYLFVCCHIKRTERLTLCLTIPFLMSVLFNSETLLMVKLVDAFAVQPKE